MHNQRRKTQEQVWVSQICLLSFFIFIFFWAIVACSRKNWIWMSARCKLIFPGNRFAVWTWAARVDWEHRQSEMWSYTCQILWAARKHPRRVGNAAASWQEAPITGTPTHLSANSSPQEAAAPSRCGSPRQGAAFASGSGVTRERGCGAVAPLPFIYFGWGMQLTGTCPSRKACNKTACKCYSGSMCSSGPWLWRQGLTPPAARFWSGK